MLSSNSEQKCQNARKPNKTYQKFRKKQGQDTSNSIGSLETELKNVDSKEVSKITFSSQISQGSGFKSDKPSFSGVVSENKKKLNEGISGLHNSENLQKNEKDISKTRDNLPQSKTQKDSPVMAESNPKAGSEMENSLGNKINKANSSKPTSVPYRNPYKKKRTDPLLISFQDILSSKRTKRRTRDHNIHKTKAQKHGNREVLSGNFLDSSNPIRRRGKHREIKKKKLSNLKMIIIKERIIKHNIRETGTDVDKIDFSTEIKAYLNKLENMKLKNSKKCKNNLTENSSGAQERENVKTEIKKEESSGVAEDLVEEKGENSRSTVCKSKDEKIPEVCKEIKFSSKFREYCDNFITPELNAAVAELIKGLINLQDRLFLRDPIKAKVKRRHVSGLREVRKYLGLKRAKMIIIAPNLEKLQMEGSIYDSINELKSMANSQNVPYGFALDRYKMGRCTKKNVPVSAFAVLSYDGIEALYENALHQLTEAKKNFLEVVEANTPKDDTKDENKKVIASLISAFREGVTVSREDQLQEDVYKCYNESKCDSTEVWWRLDWWRCKRRKGEPDWCYDDQQVVSSMNLP